MPTFDADELALAVEQRAANPNGALHHVAYATAKPLTEMVEQVKSCGLQLAASTAGGPIDAPPGWRIVNIDPSNTQGLVTQFGER